MCTYIANCPGQWQGLTHRARFIGTELSRRIAGQEPDPEAALRARRAMHASPRAGQPEEIGEAAVYLASDVAAFMTGQCLTLDGGYTVR